METTRQRILQFIEIQGIEPKDFLNKTSLKRGVIDTYHKEKGISDGFIANILEAYPNISAKWLLTGKGEMLNRSNSISEPMPTYSKVKKGIPLIPVDVVAGFSAGSVVIDHSDIQDYYNIPDFKDIDFMVTVRGTSMHPTYNSGDVVACRHVTKDKFIQWNKIHVISTRNQGVVIKRVKQSTDDTMIIAISDNKDYDPFEIPKEEILNIAIVVGGVKFE